MRHIPVRYSIVTSVKPSSRLLSHMQSMNCNMSDDLTAALAGGTMVTSLREVYPDSQVSGGELPQFLVLSLGSIAKSLQWRPILHKPPTMAVHLHPTQNPEFRPSSARGRGDKRCRTPFMHHRILQCSSASGCKGCPNPTKILCGCKRSGPFGPPTGRFALHVTPESLHLIAPSPKVTIRHS